MSQTNDQREAFLQRVADVAATTKYPCEAFLFVLEGTPLHGPIHLRSSHINAAELCWHLHDHALDRFGPRARELLAQWSIHGCEDFGHIVYALIDAGMFFKTDVAGADRPVLLIVRHHGPFARLDAGDRGRLVHCDRRGRLAGDHSGRGRVLERISNGSCTRPECGWMRESPRSGERSYD